MLFYHSWLSPYQYFVRLQIVLNTRLFFAIHVETLKQIPMLLLNIDILQGSATGNAVYSENHKITTDGSGLVNLDLGHRYCNTGNNGGCKLGSRDIFY